MNWVRLGFGGSILAIACCSGSNTIIGDPGADAGAEAAADAAGDGPSDGGAPVPRGCQGSTGHVFCADFDRGAPSDGWTEYAAGAGALTVASDSPVSPPNSLRASLPPNTGSGGPRLSTPFVGTFTKLTCRVHVAREVVGQNVLDMMSMEVNSGVATIRLRFYMGPASQDGLFQIQVQPADGGPRNGRTQPANLAFPVGQFHQVALELEGSTARAFIDGTVIATTQTIVAAPPLDARIVIGTAGTAGQSPEWVLRYDDVICDRQ